MLSRRIPHLAALLMVLATVMTLSLSSYLLLVVPRGQAFDFYWLWQGGRAVLSGQDPYGADTTRAIQLGVLGDLLPADQYQPVFPYPAYSALVLIPFLAMPFRLSVSLWLGVQLPLLLVTLLLGLDLLNWQPSTRLLSILAVLGAFGFRYPIIVLTLGQVTILVLTLVVSAAWMLRHRRPRLAGVLLALAFIRPDVALLGLVLIGLCTWRLPEIRRFLITFVVAIVILVLAPMLLIGFWPKAWSGAITTYASNPYSAWPMAVLPAPLSRVLAVLLLVSGLYLLIRLARASSSKESALCASGVVLIALLVMKQTGSYNLTYALTSAVILTRLAPRPIERTAVILSLLSPWAYMALGWRESGLELLAVPMQFLLLQLVIAKSGRRDLGR